MTYYGLNPSFVYNSPLPLFSDLRRRARRFERFTADGRPTGEDIGEDPTRWPIGMIPGLRLGEGLTVPDSSQPGLTVRTLPSGLTVAYGRDIADPNFWTVFDAPSLAALRALRPSVLRTLDLSKANLRADWSKPRVRQAALLQGTDRGMAVELQAQLANRLQCHLWWNAPARFELATSEYEARLEEMLTAIRDTADLAPVLEYGNELWNAGFPAHNWMADGGWGPWQLVAAREIATLKRVADRVFGTPGPLGARPYYLFVGGQLTVPSHLDKILAHLADIGITPDLAGPALYVTPLKAHKEEWEATKAVPTQDELRSSMFARLEQIRSATDLVGPGEPWAGVLQQTRWIIREKYRVPYFACYESGQSLIAFDERSGKAHPWRRAAIEAQKTEWMGEIYRGIRRTAEEGGVDLLCWYSHMTDQTPSDSRVDVFGLMESLDLAKMLPKAKAARGD